MWLVSHLVSFVCQSPVELADLRPDHPETPVARREVEQELLPLLVLVDQTVIEDTAHPGNCCH